MATAKTTEKKTTKKTTTPAPDPVEILAEETLVALMHRALVRLGEPARAAEIVRETDEESLTPALARHLMETRPSRFVAVDRRWDIAARHLDADRPLERILEEMVALYGAPLPVDEVSGELAQLTGRPREHYDEVGPRLLRSPLFFPIADGLAYGLRAWLLDLTSERDDDLLFYNYLNAEKLAPFAKAAHGADWENDPGGAARKMIVAANGQAVDNRIIQYYAWKSLGEEFDAASLYSSMATARETFLALPDHRWLLRDSLEPLRALWRVQAKQAERLTAEEPIAEVAADQPAKPLDITDEDAEELEGYFEGREEIVKTSDLLTHVFEVRPGSRTFAADVETLTDYLRRRPQTYLWVGTDRFRAPGSLPPYIGQLPESLRFPALPRFETTDGEILDQMLADGGLEEGLQDEILDPVAQDVNDQEPTDQTRWPEGVSAASPDIALVLKAHHKEIGTFPLAQVPPGFFPLEPGIVEITVRGTTGQGSSVYIDYNTQLVYGLFDVYGEIAADSGAVFHLAKTDKPDEYQFSDRNESDPNVFVNPGRLEELTDFRGEVEGGVPISTYDIIRRILDHHGKKGCSFLNLLTEVNLVRRTPRRLVASILSGYSAFHPRSNRWTFDPKKEPEGFDKSKSSYILKR